MATGCNINHEKVGEIESAITRLVTIQEVQTKQTDRILKSIEQYSHVNKTVEQNTDDINKLGAKIAASIESIHVKEASMTDRMDRQRKELDALGQGRLWKGVTTAVAVTIFAFGYFYTDMHNLMDKMDEARLAQREISTDLSHIQKEVSILTNMQRNHLAEIRKSKHPEM